MSNASLFSRAQSSIPGGVNSPVRSFRSVGGTPVFIKKAKGAYLYDEEGSKYIDYINSWGPMILGHAWEPLVQAVAEKVKDSTSFGAPTALEIEVAELIKSMAPNIDLVRMVNSGTEACMSALRLARGYTGRNRFIKFEGCYHGHADPFLVKAGSGVATLDIQAVPGVTEGIAMDTLTAPYNDLEAVELLVDRHKYKIAAIIIEPVAGNMGCILPAKGFLEGLRRICTKEGIVLIFDEVMTGFRLARGGAQEKLGIDADLVTYGKVIGGGMPVGAFGGRKEIMSHIAPLGKVYQAGTLSGNPIAMVAGYTLLKTLNENPGIYNELEKKGRLLEEGLHRVMREGGFAHSATVPVAEAVGNTGNSVQKSKAVQSGNAEKNYCINRMGSMISLHFGANHINNFAEAAAADNGRFNRFFHEMLKRGVYLPPSAFETWFLSNALTQQDIDDTLEAARKSLKE